MSWQWRMIQKLKRNWLVILKLTWTSQILTRALEKSKKFFCFNWLLVTKVFIVWATKVQRSYLSLKSYAHFEEKLNCSLKKDLRNLANSYQGTWNCQNCDFGGDLLSKVEKVWPSDLQRSNVSWQWRIIQNLKRNSLVISKLTWKIECFLTQALENLKNIAL